ncbi:hypothetical protein BJY01DRAFT_246433 [Aspergillus pseudoustus]|uniref:Uncharacterized protein n=1 Tax=Aspergillus pseudoustus TaxID=1810923 RepID=A0ABR4K7Y9_9EURO
MDLKHILNPRSAPQPQRPSQNTTLPESKASSSSYSLYIGMAFPQGTTTGRHWTLILAPDAATSDGGFATNCTMYHANREPWTDSLHRYKEIDVRFDHNDVCTWHLIGTIHGDEEKRAFEEIAEKVLPGPGRQRYVLGVIRMLEKEGFVYKGAWKVFMELVDEP